MDSFTYLLIGLVGGSLVAITLIKLIDLLTHLLSVALLTGVLSLASYIAKLASHPSTPPRPQR